MEIFIEITVDIFSIYPKIHSVTIIEWNNYKRCSKWPPFCWTQSSALLQRAHNFMGAASFKMRLRKNEVIFEKKIIPNEISACCDIRIGLVLL